MQTLPNRAPENDAPDPECRLLLDELARLIEERATLLEVEGPFLEARWRVLLGGLQLRVLEAECAVRRLRRKLDLIRAAVNAEEAPDPEAVERRLDAEMAEWRATIAAEASRLASARSWMSAPSLPVEDARELRTLFRRLARLCHPDVNPAGGAAAQTLWLRATNAYAHADLNELRALDLLTTEVAVDALPVEDVRERRDALGAAITRLLTEIRVIEERFPFTLRARLADPVEIEHERKRLIERHAFLADEALLAEVIITRALAGAHNA